MNALTRLLCWRAGFQVTRFHTTPFVGPGNTVGHHSAGVVALLLMHHPEPSVRLLRAALLHDVAEGVVGDVPAPAKQLFTALNDQLTQAEDDVHALLDTQHAALDEEERNWLRAADLVEALLTTHDQLLMGNEHMRLPYERIRLYMEREITTLPTPLVEYLFHELPRPAEMVLALTRELAQFHESSTEDAQ